MKEAISPVMQYAPARSRTFFPMLLRCVPFIFAIRCFHSTVFGLQFDVLGEDFYFFLSVSAEHFVFLFVSEMLYCCLAVVLPSLAYIARFREVVYFSF